MVALVSIWYLALSDNWFYREKFSHILEKTMSNGNRFFSIVYDEVDSKRLIESANINDDSINTDPRRWVKVIGERAFTSSVLDTHQCLQRTIFFIVTHMNNRTQAYASTSHAFYFHHKCFCFCYRNISRKCFVFVHLRYCIRRRSHDCFIGFRR